MTDNDMLLRLLAENFSLKDQLAKALKEKKEAEDSYVYWYRKCVAAESKPPVEDIPLSPEGLKNKCDMKTC